MGGIPVHTASPINASTATKASAITPSTSAAAARYEPTSATTTSRPSEASGASQIAQPGSAPALPQPTGTTNQYNAVPPPTRTTNEQSSTTTTIPPPPQPGAVPTPFTPQLRPPQEPAIPQPSNAIPPPLPEHQQFPGMISTPNRAQPIAGITTTTALDGHQQQHQQPRDLSHPPGYTQDSSSFQSRMPFDQDRHPASTTSTGTGRGQGLLDRDPMYVANRSTDGRSYEGEAKGVWDTAMTWAYAAGKKLSEGEEKVWKTINGEK